MKGDGGHPVASARFRHGRAKSRGGASTRTRRNAGRTPTGLTPARGQAPHLFASPPWPADAPPAWERTAVNLTKRSNREKNRAWRRLKAEDPASANGISRDLADFSRVFGQVGIYVPAEFIEEGV